MGSQIIVRGYLRGLLAAYLVPASATVGTSTDATGPVSGSGGVPTMGTGCSPARSGQSTGTVAYLADRGGSPAALP